MSCLLANRCNRLFLLLLVSSVGFMACNKHNDLPDWVQSQSKATIKDRTKVDFCISRAHYYQDTFVDIVKADSFLTEARSLAILVDDPYLILLSGNALLELKTLEPPDATHAKELFYKSLSSAKKLESESLMLDSYLAICAYFIRTGDAIEALNFINQVDRTSLLESYYEIALLLTHADINHLKKQPFLQLKNLLEAMYQSREASLDSFHRECLYKISDFYLMDHQYKKAMEYVRLVKTSLFENPPVDSVDFYFSELQRLSVMIYDEDYDGTEGIFRRVLAFAKGRKWIEMESRALSIMRTSYINQDKFLELANLYKDDPGDKRYLRSDVPSIYYRIIAYQEESKNNIDSAIYYYEYAGNFLTGENDYAYANYFKRRAQFYARNKLKRNALRDYISAFQHSLKTTDYFLQIEIGNEILSYYKLNQDLQVQLDYLRSISAAKSARIQMQSDEKVKDLELQNILAQSQLDHEKKQIYLNQKRNTQYLILILILILLFMSLVVISVYKVPSWWIKSMGYVSFIMFFEVIVLFIDQWLHEITHGSPIQIILFKVVLISFLFPLHHYVEKTFISLILENDLVDSFRTAIQSVWRVKKKEEITKVSEPGQLHEEG